VRRWWQTTGTTIGGRASVRACHVVRSSASRCLALGLVCLLAVAAAGCVAGGRPTKVALPVKYSVKSDQLMILSDIKLPADHPLLVDLKELRQQVSQTLELPLGGRPVTVYLFENELTYRQYWEVTFPGYPMRRAYFVQTPDRQLAVYTFWGDRIQEDLRHEFTHGLLHASLETVPLWLDEGLAEYFEVPGESPGEVNPEYAQKLATSVQNGWRPDLVRLERLEKVEQMQRTDYREAWAWIHFMLHSSPDTKHVLLTYLQELRTAPHPSHLSESLKADIADANGRLLNYVATLGSYGSWLTTKPAVATPASAVESGGR
jgi:hypothetical protein